MNIVGYAVKAGAFKQAAALLAEHRAGTLTVERAIFIRLTVSLDWE